MLRAQKYPLESLAEEPEKSSGVKSDLAEVKSVETEVTEVKPLQSDLEPVKADSEPRLTAPGANPAYEPPPQVIIKPNR